jgi:hypothetical protein
MANKSYLHPIEHIRLSEFLPFRRLPGASWLLLTLCAVPALSAGTAYYVDSATGNDNNNGITTSTAWKTLTKVNATTFSPGSQILFKAGCSWTGELYPKGSGTSGNPIVIDEYGTGSKPIISANGAISAVYLLNQPYWEINNLEVTNKTTLWGDYHGILINGKDFGTINHTYIRNCYIHDVHGLVAWISNSGSNTAGVIAVAGWDGSKHSGGIVFDVSTATSVKTNFNDIRIENNVISDCSFGDICIKQWQGSVGWGGRTSASDPKWYPHTNLLIQNNYLSQYNTDHGCNTIYVTNVRGGMIQNNVCAKSGVSAVELYYTDSITVQHNEMYGTVQRCNSADFNGIDADRGTTGALFQYNYVHDNGDGVLFCQISFGTAIVRYNILQNNSRNTFNLHSDASATAQAYNNVLYSNKTSGSLINSSGGTATLDLGTYVFNNNIFDAASNGPTMNKGAKCTFDHNLYYGVTAVSADAHSKTSNPLFVNPGSGGSGTASGWALSTLGGYKLQSTSPCINAGVSIAGNGGIDFWGGSLYNGAADIGANEYGSTVGLLDPSRMSGHILYPRTGPGVIYGLNGRIIGYSKPGESSSSKFGVASSAGIMKPDGKDEQAETQLLIQ